MQPGCRAAHRLLAVLSLALAVPVHGQEQASASPLGVRFALPNGAVVLVSERPSLPIVSVRVAIQAGGVLDPPGKAGLANLTVRLLPTGTETRTGPEIDGAIEAVGGQLTSEGGRDSSRVALSVLRRDLVLGLDLLADLLLHPTFPAEEFERTRAEVRATLRRSAENPESVAARTLRRLVFPGHPYATPVAGTEETLERITREDVQALYATAYRPEATTVAVVGDVTLDEVRAALEARFGGWARSERRAPLPISVTLGTPPRTVTVPRELAQTTVFVGKATITSPHPDHYPLVVANHILGGGASSRLYTRVREERSLAHRIFSHYAPGRLGGMFLVGFQSENARAREGLVLVRDELVGLRRQPVSEDELRRARAYLVGSVPLRMDTNAEVASLLLDIEQLNLGLDYPARYRRGVEAVTAEDVLRVARNHLDPDLMSLAVVGNLRAAGLTTTRVGPRSVP